MQSNNLSIVSVNCQGLNNSQKRRDVFHYLRNKKYSVYFLQDTHFEKNMEKYISAEWGYQACFSSYTSNSRGVAILFNNNFEFKLKRVIKDDLGNFIIALVEIQNSNFLFVNIYGPNRDDPEFYNNLKQKINGFGVENVIIAGDFNLVLDSVRDYHNYKHINNPKAKEAVDDMIESLDLNDIWRDINPECLRYTWRRTNPFQQARLDFFLISDTVVSFVEDVEIECGYRTDHSAVLLNLVFEKNIKRNTFWKFNSSLLKDKAYLDEINLEIKNITEEYAINTNRPINDIPDEELQFSISDSIFLDFLLMKIRSKTISYASMKKKQTFKEEQQLEQDIQRLEKIENKSEHDARVIDMKKEQLRNIREKRMEGVLLRSRARWVSEGEKVSSYFCNLEKRHYVSKNMARIINQNEDVLTNQKDILQEVHKFYKTLYTDVQVQDCKIRDLVKEIPRLNEREADNLEGEITLEEATCALKTMKNNKSPGSDGFTAEFFKVFWKKIGVFVIRALNDAFRKGELSCVQREGIITCIPKEDKPRQYIKNWRPISLLNVVYKIGSSCIANRIKLVLPKLINEDQTGFIRNRYIGENIRLIYDAIAYLEKYNLPGLLLNIDFEKAFDSINLDFMFKVLKAFGFQKDICTWIRVFYKNIKSCVIVNGQVSDWFEVKRGCRQGDPVSPYLFVLCVEILATMIRENRDIQGIAINDVEHKLSQYADDTEFLLAGDRQSFETCIETLFKFDNVSSLHMNLSKTSAVWLGSKKNSNIRYMEHLGIDWNPSKFRILGIWFTNDLKDCVKINYSERFADIKHLLKIWLKRQLTPLGRIAILKSLILSKLTHLWLLLPNPPDIFFQSCQQACYRFVWNKKPDKINRKTAFKSIKNGGIGLPELKTFVQSLKLSWIRRAEKTSHKWKHIFLSNFPKWPNFNKHGPEYLSGFTKYNQFWTDVFDAYYVFYYKCIPQNAAEVLAEPICYNKRFQIGNKYILSKKLIDKHIFCLACFVNDEGQLLSHMQFREKYNITIDFLTYAGITSTINDYVKKCGITFMNDKNIVISQCVLVNCSQFIKVLDCIMTFL